jgi:hypothetical protein
MLPLNCCRLRSSADSKSTDHCCFRTLSRQGLSVIWHLFALISAQLLIAAQWRLANSSKSSMALEHCRQDEQSLPKR